MAVKVSPTSAAAAELGAATGDGGLADTAGVTVIRADVDCGRTGP